MIASSRDEHAFTGSMTSAASWEMLGVEASTKMTANLKLDNHPSQPYFIITLMKL